MTFGIRIYLCKYIGYFKFLKDALFCLVQYHFVNKNNLKSFLTTKCNKISNVF